MSTHQADINVGMVGHVSHGKTTVVKSISGIDTKKFKKEQQENKTIHLGYANAKIYKCSNPLCTKQYRGMSSHVPDRLECTEPSCGGTLTLQVHASFVDCPGHHILMSTMLSGTCVMDVAILVISAQEECPQSQTIEHLIALEIAEVKNIIIVQNKVDLVKYDVAMNNYQQILDFVKGTIAEDAPIVPISAQSGINIDYLCRLLTKIPIPIRDTESPVFGRIIRSFDVNFPGSSIDDLRGGVIGGSISRGTVSEGDYIEISPGLMVKDSKNAIHCKPLIVKVVGIRSEKNRMKIARPGGLVAFETTLDPTLSAKDRLKGQVFGKPKTLPPLIYIMKTKHILLRKLLIFTADKKRVKPEPLFAGENLQICIGSGIAYVIVKKVDKEIAIMSLIQPICASNTSKFTILRKLEKKWMMIGYGEILDSR